MKKQLFWTLAGLSSFTLSLVALAPLPVLAQQLAKWNPGLAFAGVSGSLWKGEVQRLTTPQVVLHDVNWTFAPKKLLSGVLAADLRAEIKAAQITGQCGVTLTQKLYCSPFRAELAAENVDQLLPQGKRMPVQLGGNLVANLDNLSWDYQRIPVLNGRLLWDDGRIQAQSPTIQVDLGGRYQANLSGAAGEPLAIELLSREDTQVVLDGEVTVSPEGAYEGEVIIRASSTAEESTELAVSFLEQFGAVQNDGSIRIPIPAGQLSAPFVQPKPTETAD